MAIVFVAACLASVSRAQTPTDPHRPLDVSDLVSDEYLAKYPGVLHSEDKPDTYGPLLVEIAKFFRTRVPPIDPNESLETLAFMEAADLSKARGGVAVPLREIMK
jgi:hypothetical protein